MCAAALGDTDARTQFWTHVLDPPVASFKQLVTSESFTKQYQQEEMKKQVLYHIDNFIGNVHICLIFFLFFFSFLRQVISIIEMANYLPPPLLPLLLLSLLFCSSFSFTSSASPVFICCKFVLQYN